MRYKNTERLGIIETDKIVTAEMKWIFREQPITDVGIDAIIEKVEDGNPLGKFIALQIKSGLGNFYKAPKHLTYTVSRVHYYYWLSVNIPVILVAHIPDWEKTYWVEINESKFRKARRKWKLDIPFKQEFNANSEARLEKLLIEKQAPLINDYKLVRGDKTPHELAEDSKLIFDVNNCTKNLRDNMNDLKNISAQQTEQTILFVEQELSVKSPQVRSSYSRYGNRLLMISKRLEVEIEMFAESFAIAFSALQTITTWHFELTGELEQIKSIEEALKNFPDTADYVIGTQLNLQKTISGLSDFGIPAVQNSKNSLDEVLGVIIDEFEISKTLVINLLKEIERLKK